MGRLQSIAGSMKNKAILVAGLLLLLLLWSAGDAAPAVANPSRASLYAFQDIDGHWAESYMQELIAAGIVQGVPASVYDQVAGQSRTVYYALPDKDITRAEFATMLSNALNLTPHATTAATSLPFTDKAQIPDWAKGPAAVLYSQGIVSGYPNGNGTYSFRPMSPVNRAEMVAMLNRVVQNAAVMSLNNPFLDVRPGDWFYNAVLKAYALNIVKGMAPGYFGPYETATRAQAMTLIDNFLQGTWSSDQPGDDDLTGLVQNYYDQLVTAMNNQDDTPLLPMVTGQEELAVRDEMATPADNSLSINVTMEHPDGPPVVVKKGPYLATVRYRSLVKTNLTLGGQKLNDQPQGLDTVDLIHLQKYRGAWRIYWVQTIASRKVDV